jgi:hypothetical protein
MRLPPRWRASFDGIGNSGARRLHPDIQLHPATLPELSGMAEENFTNVFCETVIMHLPREAIATSVVRLMAILKPEGTLYRAGG